MKRTIIAAAALAVALAGEAVAEPGPIGRWLMQQPVTLWDRGMDRADAATRKAARANTSPSATVDGIARYDWKNNEIDLRVEVFRQAGTITHEQCNKLRVGFLTALRYGVALQSVDERLKTDLTEKIGEWFSHYGVQEKDRDKKLAEKLARIVFVTVVYFDDSLAEKFVCRGRVLEFEAASKPSG